MIGREPTGHTGEELTGKRLDLTARKGNEAVALEEVKHALSQQIGDNADMVAEIEAILEVNTLVAVGLVVGCQSRQYAQFNSRSVAVLLNRANDLDGTAGLPLLVVRLDHLPKSTLTQEFDDGVCREAQKSARSLDPSLFSPLTSIGQWRVGLYKVVAIIVVELFIV